MMEILRKKIASHKVELKDTGHEIDLLEERVSGLNDQLNALRENRNEKLEKFQHNVDETETNITKLLGEIDEKTQDVVEKKSSIDDKDTTETRLKQVVDMEAKLETARRKSN